MDERLPQWCIRCVPTEICLLDRLVLNSESVGFQSLGLGTGDSKMHAPKNRNSPGTLLEPFAVGLQSWANSIKSSGKGPCNSQRFHHSSWFRVNHLSQLLQSNPFWRRKKPAVAEATSPTSSGSS